MDKIKMKKLSANIRDVAEEAGVSRSTVSLVINNSPAPSAITREKVLRAIAKLKYQPDPLFRQAMRRRQATPGSRALTGMVGFLVSEPFLESSRVADGYYSRALEGVQSALDAEGHHLVLKAQKSDNSELPAMVTEGRVDGLIIENDFPEMMISILASQLPVAIIDRFYPKIEADFVNPNVEQGVTEQLTYLWEMGHRDIVTFIPKTSAHEEKYLQSFERFFHQRSESLQHPDLCRQRVLNEANHDQVIAEYVQAILNATPRPTAILTRDIYGCSMVSEFQRCGVSVPDEISIIGMDDYFYTQLCTPSLTSYRFPLEEMGAAAVELVLNRIRNRDASTRHLYINGRLIERGSCAPPRSR